MAKLDAAGRNALEDGSYAFARQRTEPLEDAAHVRDAISRSNQVMDVTDEERESAWMRIIAAT